MRNTWTLLTALFCFPLMHCGSISVLMTESKTEKDDAEMEALKQLEEEEPELARMVKSGLASIEVETYDSAPDSEAPIPQTKSVERSRKAVSASAQTRKSKSTEPTSDDLLEKAITIDLPWRVEFSYCVANGQTIVLASEPPLRICFYDVPNNRLTQSLDNNGQAFLFAAGGNRLLLYLPDSDQFRVYEVPSLKLKKSSYSPIPQVVKTLSMGWGNPHRALVHAVDGNDRFFYWVGVNELSFDPLEVMGHAPWVDSRGKAMNRQIIGDMSGSFFLAVGKPDQFLIRGDEIHFRSTTNRYWKFHATANGLIFEKRETYLASGRYCFTTSNPIRSDFSTNIPDPSGRFFIRLDQNDKASLMVSENLGFAKELRIQLWKEAYPHQAKHLENFYLLPDFGVLCQISGDKLHRTKMDIPSLLKPGTILLPSAKTYFTARRGSRFKGDLSGNSKEKLEYEILWGPSKMTIDEAGLISWRVPKHAEFEDVIIRVRDDVRRETLIYCGIAIGE